jgi:uncharacterized membrane protein
METMENFSYIWVFTLFIIHIMAATIHMSKFGESKTTTYTTGGLVVSIIATILTGLALYFWK